MALSLKRIVNVQLLSSPMAAQKRGFGVLCILGDSPIISAIEGYRSYNDADSVAGDFGVDAPETKAAQAYFSQSPQPKDLIVARWFNSPTSATLVGGTPAEIEKLKVADGAFTITIDSSSVQVAALNTSKAETLDDIAALITTKLNSKGRCVVSGGKFIVYSATAGTSSKITVASTGSGGTDLSKLLGLTEEAGAKVENGANAGDTIDQCVSNLLTNYGRNFYGLVTATKKKIEEKDIVKIAQLIQSAADAHVYGITLTDKAFASTVYTAESQDLASKLKRGNYDRTICFFAEVVEGDSAYDLNKYMAVSALGRMFTVNFDGSKTTLTLKFKQAPSLQPSNLTTTEVTNMQSRNVNVYTIYANDTYIIEEGVMCSGQFADERHGLDWLQDAIQTAVYNTLYQSKTKIPQTDDGVARLIAVIEGVLAQGVDNGLIAPGRWNSDGFGALETGDILDKGYYVYAESVNDQDQSDREKRKCPPIQFAVKLAGAIHSVDVIGSVNR